MSKNILSLAKIVNRWLVQRYRQIFDILATCNYLNEL